MFQIKITKILLNPMTKTEQVFEADDIFETDSIILNFLKSEETEKESYQDLIRKYNLAVRRFNRDKSDQIIIYTHPLPGTVVRCIIEIYQKIGKEINKLL